MQTELPSYTYNERGERLPIIARLQHRLDLLAHKGVEPRVVVLPERMRGEFEKEYFAIAMYRNTLPVLQIHFNGLPVFFSADAEHDQIF